MEPTQIGNSMSKFKIYALRRTWYEVPIEAEDEEDAFSKIDDWIADDFEEFAVTGDWELDIMEVEDNA